MAGGRNLFRRIKEENIPGIIFIFGTAEFRRTAIISRLKKALFKGDAFKDIQYFYLFNEKGDDAQTVGDLINYLKVPSLFGGNSLIIAAVQIERKKLLKREKLAFELLLNEIARKDSNTYIVFYQDTSKMRGEFLTFAREAKNRLKNEVEIVDNTFSNKADIISFITAFCLKSNLEIDMDTTKYLIEISGNDISDIRQNLSNLYYFLRDKEHKVITEDTIGAVISRSSEKTIFDLGDALGMKNFPKAIEVTNNLLMFGVFPLVIFNYIKNFYKQLFTVIVQNTDLIKQINVFLLRKYRGFSKNYEKTEFSRIFSLLLDTDYELKSSNLRAEFVFENLIFNIRRI